MHNSSRDVVQNLQAKILLFRWQCASVVAFQVQSSCFFHHHEGALIFPNFDEFQEAGGKYLAMPCALLCGARTDHAAVVVPKFRRCAQLLHPVRRVIMWNAHDDDLKNATGAECQVVHSRQLMLCLGLFFWVLQTIKAVTVFCCTLCGHMVDEKSQLPKLMFQMFEDSLHGAW
jgi:hypothetical protein